MNRRDAKWRDQRKRPASYFDQLAASRPPDHTVGDWGSKEGQLTRFQVLTELTPLSDRSVLDVGCGLTHFADYIHERFEHVKYTGIDISTKCTEVALSIHPDRDVQNLDVFDYRPERTFDVVVANGLFYLLDIDPYEAMQEMIQTLFSLTHFALAFSSLSNLGQAHGEEFCASPLKVFNYCRNMTPWVVLRHDYHLGDFIIYMYKEPPVCSSQ